MHRSIQVPAEIVEEILSRLSTKSLVRFRSVSKEWNEIITSNPYLIHKRLTSGGVAEEDRKVVCFSFHGGPLGATISKHVIKLVIPQDYWMECCCNGLYCFSEWDEPTVVHNPLTGETLELPRDPLMDKLECSCFGLGFDAKKGRFKVVHVGQFSLDLSIAQVLILGEDRWKHIDFSPPVDDEAYLHHLHGSLFLNGFVLRLTYLVQTHTRCHLVSAFDVENEVFSWFHLPCMFRNEVCTLLMELGGHLAVVVFFLDEERVEYTNIWMLKDNNYNNNPEWSLQCKIQHDLVTTRHFEVPESFTPIGPWNNDHVIFKSDLDGRFFTISIHTGNVGELISHDDNCCRGNDRVFSNSLTLIPLSLESSIT